MNSRQRELRRRKLALQVQFMFVARRCVGHRKMRFCCYFFLLCRTSSLLFISVVLNPFFAQGDGSEFPQRGLRRSPSRNQIWCIFGLKISDLVTTVLSIFLTINCLNLVQFKLSYVIGLSVPGVPKKRHPCFIFAITSVNVHRF